MRIACFDEEISIVLINCCQQHDTSYLSTISVSKVMSTFPELYWHLRTLNAFGLICCDCHKKENNKIDLVPAKDNRRAKITFCFIQLTSISILLLCILQTDYFIIEVFTETANHHSILWNIIACFVLSFVNGYFYLNRRRNIAFLQHILGYYNELCSANNSNGHLTRRYILLFFTISHLNILLNVVIFYDGLNDWKARVACMWIYSSTTSLLGIFISLYWSSVKIIEIYLKILNRRLLLVGSESLKVKSLEEIFEKRSKLLAVCYSDLNYHFALLLMITLGYVLITAPSVPYIFFFIIQRDNGLGVAYKIVLSVIALFCWTPYIVLTIVIAKCGGLHKEVRIVGENIKIK